MKRPSVRKSGEASKDQGEQSHFLPVTENHGMVMVHVFY